MGFRTFGKSKDSRDDLPQVVIGMAVTRAGIPVRVWCWPGNTSDSALIRQAREDMRDWTLARVMWVADRGFSSARNRRELRRGGGHYIIGEKLRSGSTEATHTPGGLLRVDRKKVAAEANLDGKYLLRCSDPDLSAEDIALGYKQLLEVERGWRDMKTLWSCGPCSTVSRTASALTSCSAGLRCC